jgi:hypothetical protein
MNRLACSLLVLAACTRSAEIGKGYAKVLQTMEDPPTKLDVLFMIDDSLSISDDQGPLVEAARTELFPQLRSMTGELPDLHIAIASTSVDVPGVPASPSLYCSDTPNGKFVSGAWYPETQPDATPCTVVNGPFLIDAPDGSGGRTTNYSGTIEDAFACMATTGHHGCGYEAPLEGMRRALTIPDNAGFLRDDAMLLVVFLGDEDDSSGTDPRMWPANDPFYDNARWFEYGVTCTPDDASVGPRIDCSPRTDSTEVSPIGPYIDFLHALKSDPGLVMVAGIVPPAGPISVVQVSSSWVDLGAACTPPDRNAVQGAPRMNAFMPEFPARYVLTSLCDDSMELRVHQIASSVAGVMTNRPCLLTPRGSAPDRCRAWDVAADGTRSPTTATFVTDDAMCDYTPSHLRADLGSVPAGHHVEVECLQ